MYVSMSCLIFIRGQPFPASFQGTGGLPVPGAQPLTAQWCGKNHMPLTIREPHKGEGVGACSHEETRTALYTSSLCSWLSYQLIAGRTDEGKIHCLRYAGSENIRGPVLSAWWKAGTLEPCWVRDALLPAPMGDEGERRH